jgi:hypothetical protein
MGQIRQRVLAAGLLWAAALSGQMFYEDDPLWREPPPAGVEKARSRKLSDYYDFFWHTFAKPGERQPQRGEPIRAQAVNTLGEVPDSGWYENRHGLRPMSMDELLRGPGILNAPANDGPWKVIAAKTEGVTPGLTIEDARGVRYLLKVDPASHPEMATASDVIGAKFFYALGYHAPENYIVHFTREQLRVAAGSVLVDALGKRRQMHERDVDEVLFHVPRDTAGKYRAVASLYLKGDLLGPFRFFGTRKDDPNDIVPHEHRRDLRGLFVFSAWLGHNDVKSLNSLDTLVEENGLRYVKHYLIDFGAAFGSDSFTAKSPRAGNQYLFDFKPAALQTLTLGVYVPRWARARYPDIPAVGRFESEVFEPEKWKPNYPNPAFDNRLPDDTFWAAKQVMAFTDAQIRALVKTGEYSDPAAPEWIARCLIERRDKIGRAYFARVLPLDRFEVREGRLEFENLTAKYGFGHPPRYTIRWLRFDNQSHRLDPLGAPAAFAIPREVAESRAGEYFAAEIQGAQPGKTVMVYLRGKSGGPEVVGVERTW